MPDLERKAWIEDAKLSALTVCGEEMDRLANGYHINAWESFRVELSPEHAAKVRKALELIRSVAWDLQEDSGARYEVNGYSLTRDQA